MKRDMDWILPVPPSKCFVCFRMMLYIHLPRKNGESAWLIPFNNEVPMYAREAGANQSYVLIPKDAPHTEELYQLLNELALNEELAQGVLNEVALPLCPQILWFTRRANPLAGKYGSHQGGCRTTI